MSVDSKLEMRRERWRRNKRDARARAKPDCPPPRTAFVLAVMAERDRRASLDAVSDLYDHFPYWTGEGRSLWVNRGGAGRWIPFVADVWAARTLLEKQFGTGSATPTKIADWLWMHDRHHGYAKGSIRPMVYRARKSLELLESSAEPGASGKAIWPPWTG